MVPEVRKKEEIILFTECKFGKEHTCAGDAVKCPWLSWFVPWLDAGVGQAGMFLVSELWKQLQAQVTVKQEISACQNNSFMFGEGFSMAF